MAAVTWTELVRTIARQHHMDPHEAAEKVTAVAHELELGVDTEYSERTAGEIEAIIARDADTRTERQKGKH